MSGEKPVNLSNRERIIEAGKEALDDDTIEGLLSLELDDEDLLMAIYAELDDHGTKDLEGILLRRGIEKLW